MKKLLTIYLPMGVTEFCAIAAEVDKHFPGSFMNAEGDPTEAVFYWREPGDDPA